MYFFVNIYKYLIKFTNIYILAIYFHKNRIN